MSQFGKAVSQTETLPDSQGGDFKHYNVRPISGIELVERTKSLNYCYAEAALLTFGAKEVRPCVFEDLNGEQYYLNPEGNLKPVHKEIGGTVSLHPFDTTTADVRMSAEGLSNLKPSGL